MLYDKIQKLASKILRKQADSLPVKEQRQVLQDFSFELYNKIVRAASAIGSDLATLKHMNPRIHDDVINALSKIYGQTIDIAKSINEDDPYIAVDQLHKFVQNRNTILLIKSINEMLDIWLKKHPIVDKNDKALSNPTFTGLKRLVQVSWEADEFKSAHPMNFASSHSLESNVDLSAPIRSDETFVGNRKR